MSNTTFPNFLSPNKKNKKQSYKNEEQQQLMIQSFEFQTIEKDVLKELDQISKKHCVQFFPPNSTSSKHSTGLNRTSFPLRNSNITLSPKQIRHSQENETNYTRQSTVKNNQLLNLSSTNESQIFEKTQQSMRNNLKNSNVQKRSWVSPIVQKQNQFLSQQKLLMQRQKKASFSERYQNVSFQVEAKCSAIYPYEDKKQSIDQVRKQSHSFYGESKKENSIEQLSSNLLKQSKIKRLQLSNLCQMPSFNSSFRIQRLNRDSSSQSTRNIDKIRSFSNTSYSMLNEPWVKQEFFKTINDSKVKTNSFDFYFYDDHGGIKVENMHTDVSLYKKSIDSKR